MKKARLPLVALAVVASLTLAACSSSGSSSSQSASTPAAGSWDSILAQAKGQTVNWYMWGGSDVLNNYVNGYVATKAKEFGVTLNEVKINATADAVNKVLGEIQAGKTNSGSVDLIWVNGENFATGKQANAWLCGWTNKLPNSQYVDWNNPSIANDFGLPVDGCEAPWNSAMSGVVYNSKKVNPADVASMRAFESWVKKNPGKYTYPAPPDFNGSMTVRRWFYYANAGYSQFLGAFDQAKFDAGMAKTSSLLNSLAPSLWRKGKTYPAAISDVEKLYINGEIDAYLSYDIGAVGSNIDKGLLPPTTKTAVFSEGMIGNTNYVGIPKNAAHLAAAQVLANILISPEAQLEKAKPDVLGYYPAIQMDKTPLASQYAALPSNPAVVPFTDQLKNANPELNAKWLTAIDKGWAAQVQQRK